MAPRSLLATAAVFLSSSLVASAAALKTVQLCGQYQNQTSASGLYNIGTDQWGEDGSGAQCVTYDPNATPETNATSFTATWAWSNNINDVHSFPNVAPVSREFPVQLNNTNSFDVDVAWTMGTGNSAPATTDDADLVAAYVKANVAFDCFLDLNSTKSDNASLAQYEFMVWLASYGGEQPLGWLTTINPENYTLGGYNFSLYMGNNTLGQSVYSWYPESNLANLTANLMELMQYTIDQGYLPQDAYLGIVQFGTEATHSEGNVTFTASPVLMELSVKVPRSAGVRTASSTTLLVVSFGFAMYWFGLL